MYNTRKTSVQQRLLISLDLNSLLNNTAFSKTWFNLVYHSSYYYSTISTIILTIPQGNICHGNCFINATNSPPSRIIIVSEISQVIEALQCNALRGTLCIASRMHLDLHGHHACFCTLSYCSDQSRTFSKSIFYEIFTHLLIEGVNQKSPWSKS